jgi:hypothetical protein
VRGKHFFVATTRLGRPASRASSTALSGTPVGSRGFRGRLPLALLPGGRRGQPCSLRKQRQSRRRRPTHTLLVALGDLVRTTAGKWITHPPTRCPNGHRSGRTKSSSGMSSACLGHGGDGQTSATLCPESGYLIPLLGNTQVARFVPDPVPCWLADSRPPLGCRSAPHSGRRRCPCVGGMSLGACRVVCCRVNRSLAREFGGFAPREVAVGSP